MSETKLSAIEAALLDIERSGELTPERVVDAAADEKNPLHGYFTWDDDEAAHQYRLWEARRLIRSVKVVVEVEDRTIQVPKYVHDTRERGYVPIATGRRRKSQAEVLFAYEARACLAILSRAVAIARVIVPNHEVDQFLAKAGDLLASVEGDKP